MIFNVYESFISYKFKKFKKSKILFYFVNIKVYIFIFEHFKCSYKSTILNLDSDQIKLYKFLDSTTKNIKY